MSALCFYAKRKQDVLIDIQSTFLSYSIPRGGGKD